MIFIEPPVFSRVLSGLLSDEEYRELQVYLAGQAECRGGHQRQWWYSQTQVAHTGGQGKAQNPVLPSLAHTPDRREIADCIGVTKEPRHYPHRSEMLGLVPHPNLRASAFVKCRKSTPSKQSSVAAFCAC